MRIPHLISSDASSRIVCVCVSVRVCACAKGPCHPFSRTNLQCSRPGPGFQAALRCDALCVLQDCFLQLLAVLDHHAQQQLREKQKSKESCSRARQHHRPARSAPMGAAFPSSARLPRPAGKALHPGLGRQWETGCSNNLGRWLRLLQRSAVRAAEEHASGGLGNIVPTSSAAGASGGGSTAHRTSRWEAAARGLRAPSGPPRAANSRLPTSPWCARPVQAQTPRRCLGPRREDGKDRKQRARSGAEARRQTRQVREGKEARQKAQAQGRLSGVQ